MEQTAAVVCPFPDESRFCLRMISSLAQAATPRQEWRLIPQQRVRILIQCEGDWRRETFIVVDTPITERKIHVLFFAFVDIWPWWIWKRVTLEEDISWHRNQCFVLLSINYHVYIQFSHVYNVFLNSHRKRKYSCNTSGVQNVFAGYICILDLISIKPFKTDIMKIKCYTMLRDKVTFEPRHDKTNKMSVRPVKTQISLWACAQSDQRLGCALSG